MVFPRVASAKVLSSKSPQAYALETWCIDEANAAAQIQATLTSDGWIDIQRRVDAITAVKGDYRFAARTSAGNDRCAGVYVTATMMRIGATKP